jgi:hypothetical protein
VRRATVALAVLLLPLLTAGSCDNPPSSSHPPRQRADQGQPPPAVVPPEANQPGPQNDPGACDDRGKRDVSLHATWDSETRVVPEVSYTKNGIKVPAANLSSHRNAPGHIAWGGEWSALVTVVCHDALALDVVGNSSQLSCLVTIVDLGNGPVKPGTRTCHVEYLVP